jgi:Protein of unknown function (DUF3102)
MDNPTPTRPEIGSLDDLASRIKTYHAAVLEHARNVVAKAISAGLLLKEAKGKVPYGEWLSWLKEHCELSERTAHRYMQLAANKRLIEDALRGKSATMATLSLNKAIRLIETHPDNDDGDGAASKYVKTQEALIKRLQDLLPEDVEEAAQRTIQELEATVAKIRPSAVVVNQS